MELTGGCYCGAMRYEAEGKPKLRAQCHCRECQYFSGGGPNFFLLIPPENFRYTEGTPQSFRRSDLENAVTREFCPQCGTHLATRRQDMPEVILKAGTLDRPELFGQPQIAIFTVDRQPFHFIAEEMPAYERMPRR